MKKKIMFAALFVLGFTMASNAQNTPVVDNREGNQKERIKDGVKSGELTKPEAKKLVKQQHHIKKAEAKAKSDGEVTAAERAKLDRKQDRASRNIAKQKHDKQDRN
jgi:hypothetical protein